MRPVSSGDDIRYSHPTNPVFGGKLRMGDVTEGVSASNFDDLILGKFRSVVAASALLASLVYFICDVVIVGAKKKMGRIYTARIVAAVQDIFPVRDGTIFKFPCESMGKHWPLVDVYASVAFFILGALPFPTHNQGDLLYICHDTPCRKKPI
jgi:hypothetical protein